MKELWEAVPPQHDPGIQTWLDDAADGCKLSEGRRSVKLEPNDFFDLADTSTADLFADCKYVWEILPRLQDQVRALVQPDTVVRGRVMEGAYVASELVWIEEEAVVEAGAFIDGPCYIGRGAEVRHGAYIRGNVILMEHAAPRSRQRGEQQHPSSRCQGATLRVRWR